MSIENPAFHVKAVPCHCGNQTATANGKSIDALGAAAVAFVYQYGTTTTFTAATADWKLEESSDDSNFTAITGAALTQHTAVQDAKRFCIAISMIGRKRYIRAVLTKGGTTLATAATGPLNNGGVLLAGNLAQSLGSASFDELIVVA